MMSAWNENHPPLKIVMRGTAAQALLERGWGKPRVEVATTHKSDSEGFIAVLQEVAERVKRRQP